MCSILKFMQLNYFSQITRIAKIYPNIIAKRRYQFMIKKNKTQETRNRGTFLKLIKGIHEKPTVILLKDERLKTFFLKI